MFSSDRANESKVKIAEENSVATPWTYLTEIPSMLLFCMTLVLRTSETRILNKNTGLCI